MAKFRFQDLKIWHLAIEIANELFDIADELEKRKLFRFAEQLRASGMSMSNNIAEGSGSDSKKDFSKFLNIARRSTFENANVVIILKMRGLISEETQDRLLDRLDQLCRQITSFQKTLKLENSLRFALCPMRGNHV
jgi:four helix bundle protein